MIRLGSTKKGRLRPSSILQQKGNHLGKKNIPFLHWQSWCRYQINPMFELPVTKGSGKSTGFFKDPVFVRFFGWEHWQPLRYTHLKPINCKPLFFGGPKKTTLLGMVIMVMFHGEKHSNCEWHGLTLINLATLDKRRPRSTIPGRHACTTGNWLANLWIDRMWPVRWKMKDRAQKYQVPVWCQTNYICLRRGWPNSKLPRQNWRTSRNGFRDLCLWLIQISNSKEL